MNRCFVLLLVIIAAFTCSCAKSLFTVVPNDSSAIRDTNAETARIVFLRPTEGLLSIYHIGIYDGNELIGILPSTSYFTYNTQPGKHMFGALYFFTTDFVEADIEAGKTYYVFCGLYDSFFGGTHCKMTAIKKGSENMRNVAGWFYRLKRTVLTAEGIDYYKARSDEKGVYLIGRQGLFTSRLYIEDIRRQWIERVKTTGKPMLSAEDGVENIEIAGNRKPKKKKHPSRKQTDTTQKGSFRSISTKHTKSKQSYHFPSVGETVSIDKIPSGQLTDSQISNLFSNKIVIGTHRRRGFSFQRHFRSDGFLVEKSPERGEHSGYWRTNQDCLCIRWKNKKERCGKIIKENGRINQYRVKKSGAKVRIVTFEEFVSIDEDG